MSVPFYSYPFHSLLVKLPNKGMNFPFHLLKLLNKEMEEYSKIIIVRLNLFNHLLALFRTKFACNSAIRYPVFRWESCKGCMWESVKNSSVCAIKRILATGSRKWWLARNATHVKHAENWRVITAGALQDIQFGQLVILRLKLATSPSRESSCQNTLFYRKMTFHIPSHTLL